jgi:hypothetical protein
MAPKQLKTVKVSVASIMRTAAFGRGVEEVRAGKPPDFDRESMRAAAIDSVGCDDWAYERGRQWALRAPQSMRLYIGRGLNPAAVRLFCVEEIL